MDIILTLLDYSIDQSVSEFNNFSPSIQSFQIDIQDGKFIANKTITISDFVKALPRFNQYRLSQSVFDFHLQSLSYLEELNQLAQIKNLLKIKNVFIHISLSPDLAALQKKYPDFAICPVLNPDDDVLVFAKKYNLPTLPGIQIMSVNPGPQGQQFIAASLNKIDQLRQLNYRMNIYLDGAVNQDSLPIILDRKNRPDALCIGSYFTKAEDFNSRLQELKIAIS